MPAIAPPPMTSKPVPQVRGLPVVGHSLKLLNDPLSFLMEVSELGDVVKIRIGSTPAYVINRHDLVRNMLVADAHQFSKGRQHEKLREWFGNGLITSEGDFHRRQRRLVQPAFHHARVAQYVTTIQNIAEHHVARWPDHEQFDLNDSLYRLMLSVAAKTLFSTEMNDGAIAELEQSLPILVDGTGWRSVSPIPILERLPLPANRRFNRALDAMNRVIAEIIAKYRSTGVDHGDILSTLFSARDEETGQAMTDQQIHDEVMTLLIAGSETTRTALSWACHMLTSHPDLQRRLQHEADTVLGARPATYEDLVRLEFTHRVFKETLRLYPPPWMLSRSPITDIDLGGHRIPAHSVVLYSAYALHRNRGFYPEPLHFDPDRWQTDKTAKLPREAYMPFGAGIRGCVGEPLAWAQATVVLSTIARHWTLHPSPGHVVHAKARIILVPDALPVLIQRRISLSFNLSLFRAGFAVRGMSASPVEQR